MTVIAKIMLLTIDIA